MKKNNTKIILIILNILISVFAFGQKKNSINQILKQLHNPNDPKVLVAAHRGDWRNYPENSLMAFQSAIDMGVDIIEVDLDISKDGVVVIMHDQTLDRTTNAKGKPSDYTLEELRKLKLRNGLGRLTHHQIPTLEEVMNIAKGKVLVNLDKSFPYYKETYAILKQTNTLDIGLFKSEEDFAALKTQYPNLIDSIVYMPVVNLDKPNAIQIINTYQTQMNPIAFELIFKTDTSSVLKEYDFIKKNGSKIWINSLWASLNAGHDDDEAVDKKHPEQSWTWLIEHGATLIQTDRPKELLAYLKKRKLHR